MKKEGHAHHPEKHESHEPFTHYGGGGGGGEHQEHSSGPSYDFSGHGHAGSYQNTYLY